MNEKILTRYLYNPAVIAILLISYKWIISFYFYSEDIDLRIINEVIDGHYFPLIKSFSEFNLNPSYSNETSNLKIISFPILSLLINSLFYKIFGSYSYIILEFLCVLIFVLIFKKIFYICDFSKKTSVIYALVLFVLPQILIDLSEVNLILSKISLNFETFYSLRTPRPLISNLFFFCFILLNLKFYTYKKISKKDMIFISILMGLSMHSFFYFFIFGFFLLTITYLVNYKKNILKFIIDNFKIHLLSFLIILIFYLIFYIQGNFDENDYSKRLGLIELNFSQKKILFDYFLNFFLKFEFIFIFTLNSLVFLFSKNKSVNFFYYLFLSTIVSTLCFIILFNKGIDYYHFTNWILATGLIYPLISLFYIIEKLIFKKILIKNLSFFLILSLIIYFNLSISNNQKNDNRKYLSETISFFNSKNNELYKKNKILIFDYKVSLWLIMNNYINFSIVPVSFWTPKKTTLIEDELISSFKFLNISELNFLKFLKNKKRGERIKNPNVERFFDRVYLANQLKTFNDEKNYLADEIKFIESAKPIITHQLIIPKNEFLRLKNKFKNNNKLIDPDIIILNKKKEVYSTSSLDKKIYCEAFSNKIYVIYLKKAYSENCS